MVLESSKTNASKRSVKPLRGDAHGTFAVLTPCFSHFILGTLAWMNVLYWKKFRCLQVLSCVSWTLHFSPQLSSGHSNEAPLSKPMVIVQLRKGRFSVLGEADFLDKPEGLQVQCSREQFQLRHNERDCSTILRIYPH